MAITYAVFQKKDINQFEYSQYNNVVHYNVSWIWILKEKIKLYNYRNRMSLFKCLKKKINSNSTFKLWKTFLIL